MQDGFWTRIAGSPEVKSLLESDPVRAKKDEAMRGILENESSLDNIRFYQGVHHALEWLQQLAIRRAQAEQEQQAASAAAKERAASRAARSLTDA